MECSISIGWKISRSNNNLFAASMVLLESTFLTFSIKTRKLKLQRLEVFYTKRRLKNFWIFIGKEAKYFVQD